LDKEGDKELLNLQPLLRVEDAEYNLYLRHPYTLHELFWVGRVRGFYDVEGLRGDGVEEDTPQETVDSVRLDKDLQSPGLVTCNLRGWRLSETKTNYDAL